MEEEGPQLLVSWVTLAGLQRLRHQAGSWRHSTLCVSLSVLAAVTQYPKLALYKFEVYMSYNLEIYIKVPLDKVSREDHRSLWSTGLFF
jgi:hypothetical protein